MPGPSFRNFSNSALAWQLLQKGKPTQWKAAPRSLQRGEAGGCVWLLGPPFQGGWGTYPLIPRGMAAAASKCAMVRAGKAWGLGSRPLGKVQMEDPGIFTSPRKLPHEAGPRAKCVSCS